MKTIFFFSQGIFELQFNLITGKNIFFAIELKSLKCSFDIWGKNNETIFKC
jgi:hypothetical protein